MDQNKFRPRENIITFPPVRVTERNNFETERTTVLEHDLTPSIDRAKKYDVDIAVRLWSPLNPLPRFRILDGNMLRLERVTAEPPLYVLVRIFPDNSTTKNRIAIIVDGWVVSLLKIIDDRVDRHMTVKLF